MIKYAQQYIRSAETIMNLYDGSVPFSIFLKKYFQQQKKYGSRDRKYISQLCYARFRTGHSLNINETDNRYRAALFLCEETPGDWELFFSSEWINHWKDIKTKWNFIRSIFPGSDLNKIFSWRDELSEQVDADEFCESHLIQPDLFLRIRPGYSKVVLDKLNHHSIPYQTVSENCIALPNASKLDTIIDVNKEVVIQDYSSQQTLSFPELQNAHIKTVWDCCAASGGKSLLAHDSLNDIDLTVSDIRQSIIHNLKERFAKAGIKKYNSFVADLSQPRCSVPNKNFDLIICDAPCTGSGTWGRAPENLVFFSKEKIDQYASLQKNILHNIIPQVKKGGYLLYITCSVFKKENEDAIAFIQQQSGMKLLQMKMLKGDRLKADTMFAALFQHEE